MTFQWASQLSSFPGRDRQWTITANDNGKYFNACLVSGRCNMPLPVPCNQIPDSLPQLVLVMMIVTNDPGNYTLMPFVTGDSTWRWNDLVNLEQVRYPVKSRRMMWRKAMHFSRIASDRWALHNIAWLVAIIITQIKRPRDLISQSLDLNHLNSCFLFSISSGTSVQSVCRYMNSN